MRLFDKGEPVALHHFRHRRKPFKVEVPIKYRPFRPQPNKYNPQTCNRPNEAERARKRIGADV